jgi:hypothetical protein
MDFISNADLLSKLLATVIGIATAVGVFLRWVRPKMKQAASDIRAGRDALVGREPVFDSITGAELVPALPGIGVRMSTTEQQMGVLTDAVAKLADSSLRLDDHEGRLKRLEEGVVERVVTKAESAAAWRAVEAVANGTTPDDTPLPGLGEN